MRHPASKNGRQALISEVVQRPPSSGTPTRTFVQASQSKRCGRCIGQQQRWPLRTRNSATPSRVSHHMRGEDCRLMAQHQRGCRSKCAAPGPPPNGLYQQLVVVGFLTANSCHFLSSCKAPVGLSRKVCSPGSVSTRSYARRAPLFRGTAAGHQISCHPLLQGDVIAG